MRKQAAILLCMILAGCSFSSRQQPDTTSTAITTVITEPIDPFEKNRLAKVKEDYFQGTFVSYDGFLDPLSIEPIIIEDEAKLMDVTVLINKYYAIKKGWIPDDLVSIDTNFSRPSKLRKEAADAWAELDAAAKAEGITFYARDGWRNANLQNTYFTQIYKRDKGSASRFSAYPWRSEHQLGLSMDVTDVTTTEDSLRQDMVDTPHGQFLLNEAWKYGWIVRYTKEKEMITQYNAEPWHIRYVGKELAKLLVQNDLCLEEYYGEVYQ